MAHHKDTLLEVFGLSKTRGSRNTRTRTHADQHRDKQYVPCIEIIAYIYSNIDVYI